MIEKFFIGLVSVAVVTVIVLLIILIIPQDIERTDRAKQIAKDMNCEYLGAARNMNSVRFLDCNGTIKLIRIK